MGFDFFDVIVFLMVIFLVDFLVGDEGYVVFGILFIKGVMVFVIFFYDLIIEGDMVMVLV